MNKYEKVKFLLMGAIFVVLVILALRSERVVAQPDQVGRYQISASSGNDAVYVIDTKTSEIVCLSINVGVNQKRHDLRIKAEGVAFKK